MPCANITTDPKDLGKGEENQCGKKNMLRFRVSSM